MSQDTDESEWIKIDLHIHTHDDPKDVIDYSAHQLLERARSLGFRVLAITLHDAVFDHEEVFAHAAQMGILLIPAAEVRLRGSDVILLNVCPEEIRKLRDFDDLRKLRERRGDSLFTIAPHPFYVVGGSIGRRLMREIDCFDAIEVCHFHKGLMNPNWIAAAVGSKFRKPMIATSDAHRLHAFGRHYTSIPKLRELTVEAVFTALRSGPMRITSPSCTFSELMTAFYFIFVSHPRLCRAAGRERH
jgi:predicted metal-dependent phosphoesterase TrpH